MKKFINLVIQRISEGLLTDIWNASKWMYQYVKKYWLSILFYTGIGLAETFISLGSGFMSKDLIDIITKHQTTEVVKTFAFFIGFSIGNIILSQVSSYVSNWISLKVDNEMKAEIFEKIIITDWESITTYHSGDLLTRWNSDVATISNGVLSWLPNLLINFVRFVLSLSVILYYDASFAIIALLGMPVSILMSRSILTRMQDNNNKSMEMSTKISSFNQESFSNIQLIKAFDLIKLYCQRLKQLQKEYAQMRMSFQRMSIKTSIILSTVGILVSYASYAWGIYRVWSGSISYGTMTLFLTLAATMSGTLSSLLSIVPTTINLTTSSKRLQDILNMPKEDYSDEELVKEFEHESLNDGISINLKNISYTYRGGTKVFEGSDLEAHPNEIVALVGPSGEGKTTLLRIILSLLNPNEGNCILYNAKYPEKIIKLTPASRKLFSYVPQGNTMFTGTIAENMRNVMPSATDNDIVEALKTACAWSFVEKLPLGIHSPIKEKGGGFSEGQSQRLSIARALLRKSPLLLLDEATSALDIATERQLLRNIMGDEYPRTCIVTTHRPTVLNMCKKVYKIRDMKCTSLSREEIENILKDF